MESVNQQYIRHGTIHIIRVPQGQYGLCTENAIPKFLREGILVTNSAVFQFDGLQLVNQPYVRHGNFLYLIIGSLGKRNYAYSQNSKGKSCSSNE